MDTINLNKIKDESEIKLSAENVSLLRNVIWCFTFFIMMWLVCTAFAIQRQPIVVHSDLLEQLRKKEEERFRASCLAWSQEQNRKRRRNSDVLEGEAQEIDIEMLKHLGVSAERVFQVYQCVSKAIQCFRKRQYKDFYVELNNIMMQFTGKNTLEYLAYGERVTTGLEVLISFLLHAIKAEVDCVEDNKNLPEPPDHNMFDDLKIVGGGPEDQQQSEGTVRTIISEVNARSNDWISLLNSEFSKKIALLTSLLICLPAVNSLGLTPNLLGYEGKMLEGLKFKYENFSSMSFTALMFEHTSWVALKICDMFSVISEHGVTAGMRSLFIARSDFVEFDAEYSWLKVNVKNFKCRNLVVDADGKPAPFSLDTYRFRCLKAIDKANAIERTLKHDVFALNRIRAQKFHLLDYLSECGAAQFINEKRPYPYAVMLTGSPEVGKSTVATALFDQMFLSDNATGRFGIPYTPEHIYVRNPNDEYYSGFNTSMVGMLVDDVAQKTPDVIKQLGGDDLADLIQIINTVPFLTNQAELKDKGKTPMMIRYFIGTTNTPDLSVKYVFNCPTAVYRRMAFVDVSVKEEYRKEGSVSIREGVDPKNMDVWDFMVYRFKPTAGSEPLKEYWNGTKYLQTHIPPVLNISQLMSFIRQDMDRHWTREEVNDIRKDTLLTSPVCQHGIRTMLCDQCNIVKGEADEKIRHVNWSVDDEFDDGPKLLSTLHYVKDCVVCYTMFLPIYISLLAGHIALTVRPRPFETTPIFPLRLARYLINRLPNTVEIPWYMRLYGRMPDTFINNSTVYGANCMKLYFASHYNNLWRPNFKWSDYYENEVVAKWGFALLGAFTGVFMIFKGWKYMNDPKDVGNAVESENAKEPTPTQVELMHVNYWHGQQSIGTFPAIGSTISDYDLNNKAILNTVLLCFQSTTRMVRTNGFVVQNNLVVTVFHCIAGGELPDTLSVTYLQDSGEPVRVSMKLDQTCCYIDDYNDLLFIRIDKMNMRMKLTPYFLDDVDTHIKCPGRHVYFELDSERIHVNPVTMATHAPAGKFYSYKGRQYHLQNCIVANVRDPTFGGMCGSPLILQQGKQRVIAGIHCAGPEDKSLKVSYVRIITKQMIYNVIETLHVVPVNKNESSIAFVKGNAREITYVHPKCPTHELKNKELIVLGGSTLPRAKNRTHVAQSPIVEDVLEEFKVDGYDRVLHTSPIKCDPKTAIMQSMEMAVENAQFYPSEVDDVVEALSDEFISKFTPEMMQQIHPYPLHVAINGVDGIPYLERVNLSTSGGYGHAGPKKKLFVQLPSTEEHAVYFDVNDELKEEVEWIMAQYKEGNEANPVFKCSFKDEPITHEKASISKIRIFSGSPIAFTLVVRMYFMCLIRQFVGVNRLDFEMAIGANAHGRDWLDIYNKVVKFGDDRVFAGDYKFFDKQMPPELILAAFKVMINIFKKAGWSKEDLQVAYGIAIDSAFPTMDLFGTLIRCFGSNPSGHVLTTIVNSIVNSIYMRLACRRVLLYNGIVPDMRKFGDIVSLVTYGDDNCGSVSKDYPMITHTTIQDALAEAGIIYTTDDKKSLSVGLTSVDQITFLKRRFVYHADLGRIGAPLLEDSLFKSLTVWTWSKVICDREQLASVLESANREYFFYGREIFERRHRFFKEVSVKYGCTEYLPCGLLSYDKILQELKENA